MQNLSEWLFHRTPMNYCFCILSIQHSLLFGRVQYIRLFMFEKMKIFFDSSRIRISKLWLGFLLILQIILSLKIFQNILTIRFWKRHGYKIRRTCCFCRNHSPWGVLQKNCFLKFCLFLKRQTSAYNIFKKSSRGKCFPESFAKFFRILFFKMLLISWKHFKTWYKDSRRMSYIWHSKSTGTASMNTMWLLSVS